MSRPIPRRLLPHTVSHASFIGLNGWNNPTYGTAEDVKYVRVENIKKNLLNSQGENKDDKAMLFVDSRNSSPVITFAKGDKVVFGSTTYTIREIIEECGDSSDIHHLEIALV